MASDRWVETEEAATRYLRSHGFPHAYRTGRGKAGADTVLGGTPGLVVEIKAQAVLRSAWLEQHRGAAGLPLVIWRPPKFGPAVLEQWPVLFAFSDAIALLREAGYGD